jgi:hypothetical protein
MPNHKACRATRRNSRLLKMAVHDRMLKEYRRAVKKEGVLGKHAQAIEAWLRKKGIVLAEFPGGSTWGAVDCPMPGAVCATVGKQ